jgi:hypothetical protein
LPAGKVDILHVRVTLDGKVDRKKLGTWLLSRPISDPKEITQFPSFGKAIARLAKQHGLGNQATVGLALRAQTTGEVAHIVVPIKVQDSSAAESPVSEASTTRKRLDSLKIRTSHRQSAYRGKRLAAKSQKEHLSGPQPERESKPILAIKKSQVP